MRTTIKNLTTSLLLLATSALGATVVMAATPAPVSAVPATTSEAAEPSPQQAQIQQADSLAQNGREAMSYIVAAHQLLSEQHGEEAQKYLEQAANLLTKLQAQVTAGNKNVTDPLPIYSQVGVREGVEITDELKQQLGKAHLSAARGKHKEVVETLKAVDTEIQYRFVDLPVTATLKKVESALQSLSNKDTEQASQALADAQQGLIHDSIVINAMGDDNDNAMHDDNDADDNDNDNLAG